jgi:hypothetical protein
MRGNAVRDLLALAGLALLAALEGTAMACSGRIAPGADPVSDYNPFDAVDHLRDYTATIENTSGETCVFALSFTRIDTAQSGGFAFGIESADGVPLAASAPGPASSGQLVRALAPNESHHFSYRVLIPAGQMLAPARLEQPVELTLRGLASATPSPADPVLHTSEMTVAAVVADRLGVNIAGGGTLKTVDFGVLTGGDSKRVVIEARGNRHFSLVITSLNGGAMAMAAPYQQWRVPYTLTLNGAPVSPPAALGPFGMTGIAGEAFEAVFTIGDVANKRAGLYSDEITIEIRPAL